MRARGPDQGGALGHPAGADRGVCPIRSDLRLPPGPYYYNYHYDYYSSSYFYYFTIIIITTSTHIVTITIIIVIPCPLLGAPWRSGKAP